jgi:uncharacterized repeat protein (TIGR03803 family)
MTKLIGDKLMCILPCIVLSIASHAQTTFSTLANFDGTDGAYPWSLVQGFDGNLYGTTGKGGANPRDPYGTVFKVTPTGTLTSLYSFCSRSACTDGAEPSAGLALDTDGNFYGTTRYGGLANHLLGYGTVFKISPAGILATVYDFCIQTNCADGSFPFTALLLATDGNFYGTTSDYPAEGFGTVFKITQDGVLTTLHTFDSLGGTFPGGLIQGTNGDFYGTTSSGGAFGYGTVFEMTPAGTLTTLYSFCAQVDCTDGSNPGAALIQAGDGNFYGTTGKGEPVATEQYSKSVRREH